MFHHIFLHNVASNNTIVSFKLYLRGKIWSISKLNCLRLGSRMMGNGRVWPVWWRGMGMWFVWRDPALGIYWRIERPGVFTGVLRWLMSEVRQSRPGSPGQRAQERAQVMSLTNTQATHMRAHHITCQLITKYHNETRRNSMKACLSTEFYTNTYLIKT